MKVVAATLAACALASCSTPPPTCVARGGEYPYTGTAFYVGQAGAPLAGATGGSAIVDDYSPDCSYDRMEFTVHAAGCFMWVRLDGEVRALVEPGQTCTIALADGPASLSLESGTLTFHDGDVHIVLGGAIRRTGDGGVTAGHLEWSFDGR